MTIFKPFGNNILINPKDKGKIIGETATKYLYGEVLDVGEDVKHIKKGDTIGFTLWGLTELVEADGTKHYFIIEDPQFILGVVKNGE